MSMQDLSLYNLQVIVKHIAFVGLQLVGCVHHVVGIRVAAYSIKHAKQVQGK